MHNAASRDWPRPLGALCRLVSGWSESFSSAAQGRFRRRAGDPLSCYLRNMGRDTKGQDKIVRSDEHNSRGIELADRGWPYEQIREYKKAIERDATSADTHDTVETV